MASSFEQIIDDEIQQLTELKRMARNPRMVELMREIVSRSNGNGGNAPTLSDSRTAITVQPPKYKSAPNGLYAAVLNAVRAHKGKRFLVRDLQEHMLREGFVFVAKDQRIAISSAMEGLQKGEKPVVGLVEKGVGGKPNVYEYRGE